MGALQYIVENVFLLILISICSIHCSRPCFSGMNSIGYTEPHGDISIRHGDPLNILCVLYDNEAAKFGGNASNYMTFLRGNTDLSKDMVNIVNSTAISLHIEKPSKRSSDTFFCVLKVKDTKTICLNSVSVGVAPQPIVDFKCISYNNDNLTCSWTAPENYVKTNYSLAYYDRLYTESGAEPFNCPVIQTDDKTRKKSCTWTVRTRPIYRQGVENYYFSLNVSNIFGNINMAPILFKHFENVRPGKPEKLEGVSTVWNSVYLSFMVPTTLQYFSKGLNYQVLYQCVYGKKEWVYVPGVHSVTRGYRQVAFNLTNLKYAHACYDIRVRLISAVANPTSEELWSDYASVTVITASKLPDGPPRTNIGSFEVLGYNNNSDRNIKINWSEIPDRYQNGKDFKYVVQATGTDYEEIHTTPDSYMIFEHLSSDKSYTFHIRAQNEIGTTRDYSVVRVPARKSCPQPPNDFIKDEFENGLYQLNWKKPIMEPNQVIQNYTIFWCNEKNSYTCGENLNWTVVPGSITSYNQTVVSDRSFQFAISTNTDAGSSGMRWAGCSNQPNQYSVNKVTENINFWRTDVSSDSIVIHWSLVCKDRSITGFLISYCTLFSVTQIACKETERQKRVSSSESKVKITNLKPYTTYRFQMSAIINDTTYSPPSQKVLDITTFEAAPDTPPSNLTVVKTTNTTIALTWKSPLITNGKIKYFNLYYNNYSVRIDPDNSSTVQYLLNDLRSFEKYIVKVQACTVSCSEFSKSIIAKTKIGYPSEIQRPSIMQNATHTVISWNKPDVPSGKNDYYELQLKEKYDNKNYTTVYNTSSQMWSMFLCGEDKKYNSYYVSVRAVNIDGNKNYTGKWSDEIESYCRPPSNFIVYILVTAIILFIFGIIYFTKWLYIRFKTMQNVEFKLPQGLANTVTTKNYCILGDAAVGNEGTPYVSLPSTVTDKTPLETPKISPPYVLAGDIGKTVNPGYVPYKAAESKCPSYVMASNKDLLTETLDEQVSGIPMVPSPNSSPYVKVAGNLKADILTVGTQGWQPPIVLPTNKGGYVTIGDTNPTSSFMPQRHFDAKALKQD